MKRYRCDIENTISWHHRAPLKESRVIMYGKIVHVVIVYLSHSYRGNYAHGYKPESKY